MKNSLFSTLIYRIIGKPDRWHEDYLDVMHQILDETDCFDDPDNFSELEVGEQILSRIKGTNNALEAFSTLLDESRFKMIILDGSLTPVYHNQNANGLAQDILTLNPKTREQQLTPLLCNLVKEAIESLCPDNQNHLISLKAFDSEGSQIYFRSINNQNTQIDNQSKFHLLLVLDRGRQQDLLNSEFVTQHHLTEKEQNVLLQLIHGHNIKETASDLFVSENTVKSHLKSIFRKTKTKSQADVIRLALTHEAQVLDSYFDPMSGLASSFKNEAEDKDQFVTLRSGTKVAYRTYGPENGRPIIVSHNGWGCRVMIPRSFETVLEQKQIRLIIPDRPGIGLTPLTVDRPQTWGKKLVEFVDHLDLQSYEILGAVNGSVFALLHALEAGERLKKIHLACPIFINTRADSDLLQGIYTPSVRLVRASKRFAKEIYELWLKSITMNLGKHYQSMIDNSLSDKEKQKFIDDENYEEVMQLMIESFKEAAFRNLGGISREMVFCLSPRKVDLSKITVPVEIWWGSEDNRISQKGAENLASQMPNANLHIREGYSEHIFFSLFEEILQ